MKARLWVASPMEVDLSDGAKGFEVEVQLIHNGKAIICKTFHDEIYETVDRWLREIKDGLTCQECGSAILDELCPCDRTPSERRVDAAMKRAQ